MIALNWDCTEVDIRGMLKPPLLPELSCKKD